MVLDITCVHPARSIPDLDDAPRVPDHYRRRPFPAKWGDLTFEIRNHVHGWISVIRGRQSTDAGHPILLAEWACAPREHEATAVLHGGLDEAELAVCRALTDALTATACTTSRWDDNTRIAVAQDPDSHRWVVAWLHQGVPGYATHTSWKDAHLEAAQQLDAMADSATQIRTWDSAVISAHLRRSANQVRDLVLTAELGDAVRSLNEPMRRERSITRIAQGLGVQRTFVYRVLAGKEWAAKSVLKPAAHRGNQRRTAL
ncbi:hypothetical protein SMD44_p10008 (plasmid) [Streptomyces alboflavus]|uniref:Uncharacterized protein n=1 Tax=Streptomyces alboflavus TaxID=67267 RepID=A0A291W3L4_9ACTN|nr:hypothetical protein [Streptomyces alboflavus]ATM24507.1 hypothetical protein SMD44_p10008 [Streptomyces alboflavus]